MIPETYQTQPPAPKKTGYVIGIILGIIIVSAIGFAIVNSLRPREPQVKVLDIEAERYNTSIWSDYCRARVTATIQNYGDVDASLDVKLTVDWAGEEHSTVKTVFVKAHSTATVVGDVEATTQWFNYSAEIIEVRKA